MLRGNQPKTSFPNSKEQRDVGGGARGNTINFFFKSLSPGSHLISVSNGLIKKKKTAPTKLHKEGD